jgi:phosphoglycolate phosphatase-like HAD superfamily hydrolase
VVLAGEFERALLLDLDGTLVDSAYLHTIAWQRALSSRGFELPAYRIHRLIGMGGDQLVTALLGEDAEHEHGDELREGWARQYEPLRSEVRVLPGASRLITAAGDAGWRVVFASSAPAQHLDRYLELLGASSLREWATTSEDVDETKPEPDLIEVALQLAGSERALLVGDSTHDVRAGERAGVRTVCVATGGYGAAELQRAGAAAVYETPAQLVARLGELERFAERI